MAFVKIFDEVGEMEVTVFPKLFEVAFSYLEKNKIILINGHYENDGEKESFIAEIIKLLEEE